MLRKWFVKLHGEGAAHQADVYRCVACGRLVTWNTIRGGKACCGGRVRPSRPKFMETIRLFLLPWTI